MNVSGPFACCGAAFERSIVSGTSPVNYFFVVDPNHVTSSVPTRAFYVLSPTKPKLTVHVLFRFQ